MESGYFGVDSSRILRIDNIASKEEMDFIVSSVENIDIWDNINQIDMWKNRVSDSDKLFESAPEVYRAIAKIQKRFMDKVSEFYNVKVSNPNPAIARWFVGNVQGPHADNTFYPKYHIGSVIYLNNEYTGGEIYFPQHDLEISPIAGNAVAFPGDEFFLHGVREVTSGVRYTLPIFWTVV